MACLALVGLLGCCAMAVDVGRIFLAGQKAQSAADAGAMAGGMLLANPDAAISGARTVVLANNLNAGEYAVLCNYTLGATDNDIVYYAPGSTVPGFGVLGPYAKALKVQCRVPLTYTFGQALGLRQTTVVKQSLVVRAPVGGCPIMPMWISHPTPYNYGDYQNLLMADGPFAAGIPGNFGWLSLPAGVTASWTTVMAGDPLSEADQALLFTRVGDIVWGNTGLAVGLWADALRTRITRGSTGVYANDTFSSFRADNPRIILVPLVTYLDGTGTSARFRIEKYGAFWLEAVDPQGNNKSVGGRFIRYTAPGMGMDPLANDVGVFAYRLVG